MKHHPELSDEHFSTMENAASAGDCTGLIPGAPASEAEMEAYEELYHFLPPDQGGPTAPQIPDAADPAPKASFHDTPPLSLHDDTTEKESCPKEIS